MKTKALAKTTEVTLQQMVTTETENRKILTTFINEHMKKGTDFGGIMIGGRMSKDSLFKSGAEKIASLLRLRADVVKDADTWEMSGSKEGLFCYKCNLYKVGTGELVGMGLGACSLEEKRNYNNAIKIAKKRAFVDAVLTTGALSDFFTQDLEDMSIEEKEKPLTPRQMQQEVQKREEPMSTQFQIDKINGLLKKKQKTEEPILEFFKVSTLNKLTVSQANKAVEKLQTFPDVVQKEEEIDIDEVDKELSK